VLARPSRTLGAGPGVNANRDLPGLAHRLRRIDVQVLGELKVNSRKPRPWNAEGHWARRPAWAREQKTASMWITPGSGRGGTGGRLWRCPPSERAQVRSRSLKATGGISPAREPRATIARMRLRVIDHLAGGKRAVLACLAHPAPARKGKRAAARGLSRAVIRPRSGAREYGLCQVLRETAKTPGTPRKGVGHVDASQPLRNSSTSCCAANAPAPRPC
jgi:hypothetical protein